MEALVLDMHWATIGQWHDCYGTASNDMQEQTTPDFTNHVVEASEPGSVTPKTFESCANLACAEDVQTATLWASITSKAAVTIQKAYRALQKRPCVEDVCSSAVACPTAHTDTGSSVSEECADDDLHVVSMSIEEFREKFYPLMGFDCIRKYHMSGMRDYNEQVWYQIREDDPARAQTSAAERSSQAAVSTAKDDFIGLELCATAEEDATDLFKPLDTCLEYMVKFLEGEHAKSEKRPPNIKSHVLKTVRETMAWKSGDRTADQVKQKINQLNEKMSAIVQNL